jgi:hypothetical protein
MVSLIRYPSVIFLVSLFIFWFSARIGVYLRKWTPNLDEEAFKDLDVIATSTLTLLGLIIGFSFSMAISRYDQRKNYEEEEANAIGTEYLRVDLLPTADAGKARTLLRDYLDQRILFYETRDEIQLLKVNATTSQMQDQLWSAVRTTRGGSNFTDSSARTVRFRNERCDQYHWLHASRMVESNSAGGLGSDGVHGNLQQRARELLQTSNGCERYPVSDSSANSGHCVFRNCRHR